MARRVALARAVAMDPKLILYDEPFAGLDPISLTITARLIRELNDVLDAGSVIVTHDVLESFQIVDYVYLMWQGRIVAQGTPDQMRDSSVPYGASLLMQKLTALCLFINRPCPSFRIWA